MSAEQTGTETRASKSHGTSVKDRLQSLVRRVAEHELMMRAAALSFYFIFALFPLTLSLLAVVGMYAQDPETHIAIVHQLTRLLPEAAASLIQNTIGELEKYTSGWKLL